MSRSKCSRELYCSFLDVTAERYPALSLSGVAPESLALSHDSISRRLSGERVQPKDSWAAGRTGILAFDDVVIDKSRSGKTENDRFRDMPASTRQRQQPTAGTPV
jgi:hypothetical protein